MQKYSNIRIFDYNPIVPSYSYEYKIQCVFCFTPWKLRIYELDLFVDGFVELWITKM